MHMSAPYAHGQNGKIERAHRTVVEVARSLRIQSRLPATLWPEFVRTATYLLNRSPSKSLDYKTPLGRLQECLGGTSTIGLSHVKVVGCKSYAKNYNRKKGEKMESRTYVRYLVGFEASNIWRIWLPEQNRVLRTRDVVFDETQMYGPTTPNTNQLPTDLHESVTTVECPQLLSILNHDDDYVYNFDFLMFQSFNQPEVKNTPTRKLVSSLRESTPEALQSQLSTPSPTPSTNAVQIGAVIDTSLPLRDAAADGEEDNDIDPIASSSEVTKKKSHQKSHPR